MWANVSVFGNKCHHCSKQLRPLRFNPLGAFLFQQSDNWKANNMTAQSISITDIDNCGTLEVRQDHAAQSQPKYFLQFQTKNCLPWADLSVSQVKQLIAFLQAQVDAMEPPQAAPVTEAAPRKSPPSYANLSDQSKTVLQHMRRAGSLSAREAMNDYGITSATLARRMCDIEENGFKIERQRRVHPLTSRRYTRYMLGADA